MNKIKKINIALTNRCNLRCVHCDIWKQVPKTDIAPELLSRLLRDSCLSKDPDLTLTGGEPFLHPHIAKIFDVIFTQSPRALKTISTNGVLKGKILAFLRRYGKFLSPGFSLHVSMDGIKHHQKMRGVPAETIMKNIGDFRAIAPRINVKIKFTITPLNYTDIIPSYLYAKSNGMDFKVKLIEYAAHYTNRMGRPAMKFDAKAKKEIIDSLSKIFRFESCNSKDAHFIKNTIGLLQGEKNPFACKTPFKRIFIFADGEVHSCVHCESLGNLNESSQKEIWNSRKAEVIRNKVRGEGCHRCVAFHGFQE